MTLLSPLKQLLYIHRGKERLMSPFQQMPGPIDDFTDEAYDDIVNVYKKSLRISMWETEFKLGQVQVAIERLVKEHNISLLEWNLKTERVKKILGDLLQQRDELLAYLESHSNKVVAPN